jgi:hypothetical protein
MAASGFGFAGDSCGFGFGRIAQPGGGGLRFGVHLGALRIGVGAQLHLLCFRLGLR